ncbi:MAG: hypothetical protein HY708_03430 [Ignavibacteriae bacterium]|nr:hypothetical protein [Ignavibacteriota bacterium]
MGNQALVLVAGTLLLVLVYVMGFNGTSSDLTKNSNLSFAQNVAKEINTSAMEIAMNTLADSATWRSTFSNMQLFGGTSTVTFKDTVVGSDTAVVVRSFSRYVAGSDSSNASTRAVVKPTPRGYVPPVVRAAFTAFGSINDAISDMFIDGRNFRSNGFTVVPRTGKYAVSTGQSNFVNTEEGYLGGTTYTTNPATDISPSFPEDSRVVETNSSWPNGWPATPDAALGVPEETLKNIAQTRSIPGSQYVTAYNQLVFPLKGVTYIEVPPGTEWKKLKIGANPEGILVFHSSATDAYWNNISTTAGPFKGLMLFDNAFHLHIDILGGIVILTPNTVTGKECKGNKDHWIRYSSETIMNMTASTEVAMKGSWKDRLTVLSWYE